MLKSLLIVATAAVLSTRVFAASDPCVKLADAVWAAPADVRACFASFPLNDTLRTNLLNIAKSAVLTFHTSTNYQLQAPPPYDKDVHVDFEKEFARIAKTQYTSYCKLSFQKTYLYAEVDDSIVS